MITSDPQNNTIENSQDNTIENSQANQQTPNVKDAPGRLSSLFSPLSSLPTSRRRFLQTAAVVGAASLVAACTGKKAAKALLAEDEQPSDHKMTYRDNPNTGDRVSLLGYGCMRLPTLDGSTKEAPKIDQEEVNRQVDYAMAHGVNYYDTSPVYCQGLSEGVMGRALSRHPRDSYYLATKLSNFAPEFWTLEASKRMFENSLRQLQTDYVDYLLLHSVGNGGMETFDHRYMDNGVYEWMKTLKGQGKIRNLGFSYHGDIAVFDRLLALQDAGDVHWDFVQIQLNYIDWQHAKTVNDANTDASYLYGELEKRGIPAVIMEPLLGGRLADMPQPIVSKLKEQRPDDSVASWAFRYAGTPQGVLTVLSGMTYMDHIRENVATYSPLHPITEDEDVLLQRIAVEFLENDSVPCTACQYCMPCPYGLDIPGIFSHYNKCVNDDLVLHDRQEPRYASARRAFLVGYDRAVSPLRQAGHCTQCGECTPHCPQSIDIPSQLARIDAYTETLRRQTPA